MLKKVHIKKHFTVFTVITFVFFAIYSALLLVMILWSVNLSLKDATSWESSSSWAPAFDFSIENYAKVFKAMTVEVEGESFSLIHTFFNSLIYAGGAAFCQAFCTCLVAYLTAKYDYKFSRIFHSIVIVTMALPIVGSLASQVEVFRFLGFESNTLTNLLGVYFMKFGFTNVYYLVMYAAFKSISWDYAESAFIDGASHFRVFFKIMLPLVSSMFFVIFLLYFIEYWNDYQFPMIFLKKMPTVSYALYNFKNVTGRYDVETASVPAQIAGGVLVFLPIMILFAIFRNKLMGNLTTGGIKG